jgi:hypothetical protein
VTEENAAAIIAGDEEREVAAEFGFPEDIVAMSESAMDNFLSCGGFGEQS